MGTSDRRPYLTATVLDQNFLDLAQDNLENRLEMVADIESPVDTIYVSDRNKYILVSGAGRFYEALTKFPLIRRTMGEWLAPEIEFSGLELELSNVDGRYSNLLPGGDDYDGWIGRPVLVKMGLRDVEATYTTIFRGRVHDEGGFQRTRSSAKISARDELDKLNTNFPTAVFKTTTFPDLEDNFVGLTAPIIYGDWTTALKTVKLKPADPDSPTATVGIIPAFVVNGAHTDVLAGTENLQLIISENNNTFLNTSEIYLQRGDSYYLIDSADVVNVVNARQLEIKQQNNGGVTIIEDEASPNYTYSSGDQFWVKMRGKDLSPYNDNIVWQARDILITFGGATPADFDSTSWTTLRDKNPGGSPQNAISTVKSRIWKQDPEEAVRFALSLLEQVRLEMFVDRNLKLKLSSLHFDDIGTKWNSGSPSFTIKNWDVAQDSLEPRLDDRNVWNRAQADYGFDPSAGENAFGTAVYRNDAAITQMGKTISKKVVFPNLYVASDVENNLKEMLKLASSGAEMITVDLTSRAFLRDLSEVTRLDVDLGSTVLQGVPAMFREIGYDPNGYKIPVKLWSFQMVPFDGYNPGYPGIVGGFNASITAE